MPLYVRTIVITTAPELTAEALDRHAEHLRDLRRRGKLRTAGRLGDDGFLDILEVEDLFEAEALARASPLIDEGFGTWTLREWTEIEAAEIEA